MSRKRSSETGPPTLLCFWIESGHLSPENNYSGSWTCCVIRDKGLSSSDQNAAGLEVTSRFRNPPHQASIPDALRDPNQARGYSALTSTSVGRMAGSPPVALISLAVMGMSLQFSHISLSSSFSFRTENHKQIL